MANLMQGLKCAHEPCTCAVEAGEQYCSRACKEDAAQGDVSSTRNGCRCSHTACETR